MKFASKDFKTVNQVFKAGDVLPDDIDAEKWARFIKDDTASPDVPATADKPAADFKF